jgi:hypothetical protein
MFCIKINLFLQLNKLIIRVNIKNNKYKRDLIDIKFYFEEEKEMQGINLLV